MATTVARLQAVLGVDTKGFHSGMLGAEKKMSMSQKVIGGAALGIAGGIGFLGAKAVNAAADFEQGMNKMQAVSGATDDQMKEIQKTAIKLGNDIKLPGTSAKDAADAMTELSKSGLSVDQTMKAVRPTLLLSAAANVSNARAAEITSNALNAFGLDASRTSKVVDLLANAANASSLEIEDAADSMKMAGAVFAGFMGPAVGAEQALKDLTTATAILGNAGIKGSDAGTSLKQMLLQLTGPSNKAKDAMKALYLAAQGAAVSQEQLTQAATGSTKERFKAIEAIEKSNKSLQVEGDIAFDAQGKLRSLRDIIGLVAKGTKTMTQEQRANYITQIFGADASRAVIALMTAQVKGWDAMSKTIDKNGSAQELAAAKMKGMRGAQEALKSSLDTLAITFGLTLLPFVTKMIQTFTQFTGIIAQHQTATKLVTAALFSLAVAYVAVIAVQKAYTALMVISNAALAVYRARMIAVRTALLAAAAAQMILNVALLANPIVLVIVALAALGVALVIAYQKVKFFREGVNAAWSWIKDHWPLLVGIFAGPLGLAIVEIIKHRNQIVAIFTSLPKLAAAGFESAKNALIQKFRDIIGALPKIVRKLLGIDSPSKVFVEIGKQVIYGMIKGLGEAAPALLKKAGELFAPIAGLVGGGTAAPGIQLGGIHDRGSAERYLIPFANQEGIAVTSVATGNHVAGSYHYKHRAIDVSGTAGQMRKFFFDAIRRFSVGNITELFYDPIGSYIKNGHVVRGAIGGHSDHVHIALGSGGIVTKAMNALIGERGREAVIPLDSPQGRSVIGGTVVFNFPNYVGSKQELMSMLKVAAREFQRQNGRPAFGV